MSDLLARLAPFNRVTFDRIEAGSTYITTEISWFDSKYFGDKSIAKKTDRVLYRVYLYDDERIINDAPAFFVPYEAIKPTLQEALEEALRLAEETP